MLKKYDDFIITNDEIVFLEYLHSQINNDGVLRIFLSSDEIKIANKLVKKGLIDKGISDAKNGTTIFFINRKGQQCLQNIDKNNIQ